MRLSGIAKVPSNTARVSPNAREPLKAARLLNPMLLKQRLNPIAGTNPTQNASCKPEIPDVPYTIGPAITITTTAMMRLCSPKVLRRLFNPAIGTSISCNEQIFRGVLRPEPTKQILGCSGHKVQSKLDFFTAGCTPPFGRPRLSLRKASTQPAVFP